MTRMARAIVPGYVHHVVQRTCLKKKVFNSAQEYEKYLALLESYSVSKGVSIWAYCLLPQSVHLVVVPRDETALGNMIRDVHTLYAGYYNASHGHSGRIWHDRYQSCVVDDLLVMTAVRMVELYPVRLGLAKEAEDYPWSSASDHCNARNNPLLEKNFPPPDALENWRDFLKSAPRAGTLERQLEMYTRTGRPWGTLEFVTSLERQFHRSFIPLKRGPKPGMHKKK